MADWNTLLTFAIAPKSGPLRKMVRLRDAKRALEELPPGYMKRVHWLRASACLVTAAETGKPKDIEWAFEAVVAALEEEEWLPQGASRLPLPRIDLPRFDPLRFESLRRVGPSVGSFTARRAAEPLWRRTHPARTDWKPGENQQQASGSLKPGPKDLEQFVRKYLLFL